MKEMQTFHNAFDKIIKEWEVDENGKPTFDYILETGDISQNGRRRNEYHGYFEGLQGWNKRVPIMSCMGNNDLLEKKFGQCFANFFTNENQWANSVYRYRLGDVEFIGLNSNTDYDYVQGQGTLGNYANTDAFLLDQAKWLDEYLTNLDTSFMCSKYQPLNQKNAPYILTIEKK
jgi:predicted MPP superfamily phosphohydrolase